MPDMMYPGFRGMVPSFGGQISPLQPSFPSGNPIMGMPPPGTPGVGAGFANPGGGMGGGPLQGGLQTGTGGGPSMGTGMPPIMQMPPPGGPMPGSPFGPSSGGNPIMQMPMPGAPGTGTGMSPIARQLLMQRFAQPQSGGGYAGRDLFPAAMMNRYNMS